MVIALPPMLYLVWQRFKTKVSEHRVLLFTLVLILCSALNSVLYQRLVKQMQTYSIVFTQIVYPLSFTVLTWGTSLIIYRDRLFCLGGLRPPYPDEPDCSKEEPELRFALKKHWSVLLILATVDTLGGIAVLFPVIYLAPVVLLVVAQFTIPFNFFFTRVVLKAKFEWIHYYAAVIVVAGVVTASYSTGTLIDPGKWGMITFWCLWLILVQLIASSLSIYRERKLKDLRLKPLHALVWIAVFQLPLSLLAIGVIFLPLAAPFDPLPATLKAFNAFLVQGFTHFASDRNWLIFIFLLACNIVSNIVDLKLTQERSSNYTLISTIPRVGLTAILLSIPFIAGIATQTFTFLHGVGFVTVLAGILVYNYVPYGEYRPHNVDDYEPAPTRRSQTLKEATMILEDGNL